MFEKIPTRKIDKIVAGVTAAGLAMGAAETTIASTVSEQQTNKPIVQKSEVNYAQVQKQRLERKFGVKIVMPEANDSIDHQEQEKTMERDYALDFNLGASSNNIKKDSPEMDLAKALYGSDKYYLDNEGCLYKESALNQMIVKYGEKRFVEVVEILKKIYPNGNEKDMKDVLKTYSFSLPELKSKSDSGRKEKLNVKLYNIADLMEEGGAEKLAELFDLLQKEGYSKAYDFSWDTKKVADMLSDSEERKALVDYSNRVGLQMRILEEESGLPHEEFLNLSYKEKMKIFESLKEQGKVSDAKK